MGHPDFRIGGKIIASLGSPDADWGMVKLTPDQQAALIETNGGACQPCRGIWGLRGYTNIRLAEATQSLVRSALELAFENATNK